MINVETFETIFIMGYMAVAPMIAYLLVHKLLSLIASKIKYHGKEKPFYLREWFLIVLSIILAIIPAWIFIGLLGLIQFRPNYIIE